MLRAKCVVLRCCVASKTFTDASRPAREDAQAATLRTLTRADDGSPAPRKEAFQSLATFLQTAASWSFEERLAFCRWLLAASLTLGDRGSPLPQPLLAEIAVPTVKEWSRRDPNSAEAHLWLGMMRCDDPLMHLARAMDLDPFGIGSLELGGLARSFRPIPGT
jgi:hypothetical protein